MREGQTEVLVVGAGPVGLWLALSLAEAGVQVSIIDRESRITARNYACALHPLTLKLLNRFGLTTAALERGRRIQKLAFYEGQSRQAEIDLSNLPRDFPFLLLLPQSALEGLLEQRLRQSGVTVQWNHRFAGLVEEQEQVSATLEELEGTSTGYIVPHWETVVKRRFPVRAQFLVGADGHNSLTRQKLGIKFDHAGETESFAAYEFEADRAGEDEVRIVLDQTTTNVLWPLGQNRFRWTFQLSRADAARELPDKDRRALRLEQPIIDERIRECVERVARHRAPWFDATVKTITWCTEVAFQRRLASSFGRNRCWLAGDAAHQTGPVGVQSMNAGLREAWQLAEALRQILQENVDLNLLESYDREARDQWRGLLGLTGGLRTSANVSNWIRERYDRIIPCLPGLGADLASLARQLNLEFASDSSLAPGLLSQHKSV
jgi:2-polyprenyl-6-methoxyphenol hydroxylase-like FAD-dependent oxidoreductase